jgi:hypothetical protein
MLLVWKFAGFSILIWCLDIGCEGVEMITRD